MKMLTKNIIWSIGLCTSLIALISSCKKDEVAADKTCKVAFILNLTNLAGDTIFVNVVAGELAQNAPAPTRPGFNFDGWYTSAADANPDPTKNVAAPKFPVYDVTVKPIYLDMILYARWKK